MSGCWPGQRSASASSSDRPHRRKSLTWRGVPRMCRRVSEGKDNMQERRTMTKADIIETVYEKVGGFSKKEAAEIVETVFDTIKETLERGEKIKISGFGNFVVRKKRSRRGRNPQTGEDIEIGARRILTFKPSQVLKAGLNHPVEVKQE